MIMESEPYLQFRLPKKEGLIAHVNELLQKYQETVTKNG
jgi:hypothetical protein